MDMKKILRALDGAAEKPKVEAGDMKKFLTIVEGKGPLNRLTPAESIALNHYNTETKKDITSPVLNIPLGAKPSMIGKYFKEVKEEFEESAVRSKDRARQLAEIVTKKINESNLRDLEDLYAKRKALQDIQLDPETGKDPELVREVIRRKAELEREAREQGLSEGVEDETVDTVTVNIPLLIRLLEFAREDATDDMTLHTVTQNLINLSKDFDVLSMDQYDAIVGDQLALPAPDENKDGKEDY